MKQRAEDREVFGYWTWNPENLKVQLTLRRAVIKCQFPGAQTLKSLPLG